MKYQLTFTFGLLLICLFTSCDKELEEINRNPAVLNDVELRHLLPNAIAGAYYSKGQITAISAGFVSQQIDAELCVAIVNSRDRMDTYWKDSFYGGVLKDNKVLIEQASKKGNKRFYEGVGKILIAYAFGAETAAFGDMPFSEALKGGQILRPAYDSQELIYEGILELLDEAIEDLSVESEYSGGDLIFEGDAEKWIKNAYALKMRFYLHLSKNNPAYLQQIMDIKDQAVRNRSDQAVFSFGANENETWALHRWSKERPWLLEIHPLLESLMENSNDPRRTVHFNYAYSDPLFFQPNVENTIHWLKPDVSIPLISLSEVYFIEAETMLRLGSTKAAVSETLSRAIRESMEMLELAPADYQVYLDEYAVLSTSADAEADLKQIITEAYKAYFGFNFREAWNNQRRTGYPALLPMDMAPNIWNPSSGPVLRFLYPQSEFDTNREQVERAELNQNGALLDDPLWVF